MCFKNIPNGTRLIFLGSMCTEKKKDVKFWNYLLTSDEKKILK